MTTIHGNTDIDDCESLFRSLSRDSWWDLRNKIHKKRSIQRQPPVNESETKNEA
jgi:hypothetical protein